MGPGEGSHEYFNSLMTETPPSIESTQRLDFMKAAEVRQVEINNISITTYLLQIDLTGPKLIQASVWPE